MTKDEAKQKVGELVAKYESLSPAEVKKFNEANTKLAFILPLFAALGWDIFDTNEVALEEAASNKRVDFAFKINNVARFYVEAKPLKADLNNPDYVKQAITYAYNNGVTWAILTNFEELRLYNALNNKPFIQLNCKDFVAGFDKLWLLSRAIITTEAFNKEATQYGVLPPAIPIEERLFKQLLQWREKLFNELFLLSDGTLKLKQNQIDEIIQKLFNRLIFIRTAEDRNLEEKLLLAAVHQHKNGLPLASLREIFQHYQGFYDSDLFEKHLLDNDKLHIHDTTLTEIIKGLYEIPSGIADYDFSIIDADVLGRVYEQYLGYVASVVKEKAKAIQAKLDLGIKADTEFEVTAKKQRRKEQGIYYTPKFVTDFIVKETVGRFIKENEADGYDKILKMKILDPACGSGSFLIRAYDELLNYHARVRGKTPNEMEQQDRMPILTRNIFGVDLDHQAVEIARLNLLLRGLAKRDLLPPLTDNIRQGNSLISGAEKELKGYFGKDWQAKHPFNWQDEFKDIMAGGGFDIIISNPPYLRVSGIDEDIDHYVRNHFETIFGHFDYYIAFLERSVKLLKTGGLLGFIVPNKFLVRSYARHFRSWLLDNAILIRLVDVSTIPVFGEASIYPVMIILSRASAKNETRPNLSVARITPEMFSTLLATGDLTYSGVDQDSFRKNKYCTFDVSITGSEETIFRRMENGVESLGMFARALTGTPAINLFYKWGELMVSKENLNKNETTLPFINVSNVSRYIISWGGKIRAAKRRLSSPYLRFHPEYVGDNKWRVFSIHPKIVISGTAKHLTAALDDVGYANLSLYAIVDWESKRPYHINYLLALINSTLLDFWFTKKFGSTHMAGGYITYNAIYLEQLPIRRIDFKNSDDKQAHDSIVALVEKMLELHKKLAPLKEIFSDEREQLLKEIAKTDKEIDNLVYDLYGLTEAERKIVEANT